VNNREAEAAASNIVASESAKKWAASMLAARLAKAKQRVGKAAMPAAWFHGKTPNQGGPMITFDDNNQDPDTQLHTHKVPAMPMQTQPHGEPEQKRA
jgi:hypothetical protein